MLDYVTLRTKDLGQERCHAREIPCSYARAFCR